jgi:hypothetical protein
VLLVLEFGTGSNSIFTMMDGMEPLDRCFSIRASEAVHRRSSVLHGTGIGKDKIDGRGTADLLIRIRNIVGRRSQMRSVDVRFLIGLAFGYAIGILIAPASGEATRARITRRIDSSAREKAREIGARAGEMAYEELKQSV